MISKKQWIAAVAVLVFGACALWACLPRVLRWAMGLNKVPPGTPVVAAIALNAPIDFYGKVLDQNDRPVSGAEVRLQYSAYEMSGIYIDRGPPMRPLSATTRQDGIFEVHQTGLRLELLDIRREGFLFNDRGGAWYWSYRPGVASLTDRPFHPQVFHVWKNIGTPEPLWDVGREPINLEDIQFDAPVSVFLRPTASIPKSCIKPGKESDADWWLTIEKGPKRPKGPKFVYDWSVRLECRHGGVMKTDDNYNFLAPENGYVSEFTFEADTSKPGWKQEMKQQFFVNIRDGSIYGFLTLEIMTGTKPIVYLTGVLNPSGSRNLQPGGGFLNQ